MQPIEAIKIQGFRSHLKTEVKGLAKFNLFIGPNGSGKSSLLDAVDYCLTGTCRGTDDAGRGHEDLLTSTEGGKAKTAWISLRIGGKDHVRSVGQGPKSSFQEQMAALSKASIRALRVFTQTGTFLNLAAKEQRELVMAVASSDVGEKVIEEALGDDAVTLGINPATLTSLDGVNSMDKGLRARRPTLKAEIDAITVQAPEWPESVPTKFQGQPLAGVLDKARATLNQIRKEREGILSGASRAKAYSGELDGLTQELEDLQKKSDINPAEANGAIKDLQKEREDLEREMEVWQTDLNEAKTSRENLDRDLKRNEAELERLKKLGKCPTCYQEVGEKHIASIAKGVKAAAAKLTEQMQALDDEIKTLSTRTFSRQASDIWAEIGEIEKGLQEFVSDSKRVKAIQARRSELTELLNSTVPDTTTDELDKRIEKGDAIYTALMTYSAQVSAADLGKKRIDELQAELDATEHVIKALSADGPIRNALLGGGLKELEEELSSLAAGVQMPTVSIRSDPWEIMVGIRPARMLSDSEKWRLNMVFSACLAHRMGDFGVLCLDAAEILDKENRGFLVGLLEQSGLNQVLRAATPADYPEYAPGGPNWAFFRVGKDDGGISTVTQIPVAEPADNMAEAA